MTDEAHLLPLSVTVGVSVLVLPILVDYYY